MPTIVGILTFLGMIYTRVWKQEKSLFFNILVFMSSWILILIWIEHEESVITSGQVWALPGGKPQGHP